MSTPRRSVFSVLLALAITAAWPVPAAADGYALVGNARAAPASLSRSDVRALYTGKTKTIGGSAVVVVIRGENDATFGEFVDQVFAIPARALLSKIKQEVFKGEMTKPTRATSDDEVVQAVGASPGMIGVVSSLMIGRLPKTVAVIPIALGE